MYQWLSVCDSESSEAKMKELKSTCDATTPAYGISHL